MRSWRGSGMVAAAMLAAAVLGAPAPAPAAVLTGVADSDAATFTDAAWTGLGTTRARAVAPWDVALHTDSATVARRKVLDDWVAAGNARGAELVVALESSAADPDTAPSPDDYATAFSAFLTRYPSVRIIAPWNEPNLDTTPNPPALHDDPSLAATYWLRARDACPGCTLIAGEFASILGDDAYVKAYQQALGSARPAVWGFHDHTDANQFQSPGAPDHAPYARAILADLGPPFDTGRIWITEVGAYYRDVFGTQYGDASQRATTQFILGLATLDPRIDRIYYYNLSNQCSTASRCATQDRGLVAPSPFDRSALDSGYDTAGRLRGAYAVWRDGGPAIPPAPAPLLPVSLDRPLDASVSRDATPILSGRAGTGSAGATVTVRVWPGALAQGSPLLTLNAPRSGASWSATSPSRLGDGQYTATATQLDGNGAPTTSAAHTFRLDTTPPDTTITGAPGPGPTAARALRLGVDGTEAGSTLRCSVDGRASTACATSIVMRTLTNGPHSLTVRATDPAGNADPTPARAVWTVAPAMWVVGQGTVVTRARVKTKRARAAKRAGSAEQARSAKRRRAPKPTRTVITAATARLAVRCSDACGPGGAALYLDGTRARKLGVRGGSVSGPDVGLPAGTRAVRIARADMSALGRVTAVTLPLSPTARAALDRAATLPVRLVVAARPSRLPARRLLLRYALHAKPAPLTGPLTIPLACAQACLATATATLDAATARRLRVPAVLAVAARPPLRLSLTAATGRRLRAARVRLRLTTTVASPGAPAAAVQDAPLVTANAIAGY